MKKLILLGLFFTLNANATSIGYLQGMHFPDNSLYNSHPFVELGDNVLIYENSFEKIGVAAYTKFEYDVFKLRVGLTTGYKPKMQYKGQEYKTIAISDGIMPFIVPSLEIPVNNKIKAVGAVLGNSVNIGLAIEF